jgi:hypothetical protein
MVAFAGAIDRLRAGGPRSRRSDQGGRRAQHADLDPVPVLEDRASQCLDDLALAVVEIQEM